MHIEKLFVRYSHMAFVFRKYDLWVTANRIHGLWAAWERCAARRCEFSLSRLSAGRSLPLILLSISRRYVCVSNSHSSLDAYESYEFLIDVSVSFYTHIPNILFVLSKNINSNRGTCSNVTFLKLYRFCRYNLFHHLLIAFLSMFKCFTINSFN